MTRSRESNEALSLPSQTFPLENSRLSGEKRRRGKGATCAFAHSPLLFHLPRNPSCALTRRCGINTLGGSHLRRAIPLPPRLSGSTPEQQSWSSGKIQPEVFMKGRHKRLTFQPANCDRACQTPDWSSSNTDTRNWVCSNNDLSFSLIIELWS